MTDPVAQTTVQPTEPTLDVLSEPMFIHSLRIKTDENVRLIG
jgi:hypothetical protein